MPVSGRVRGRFQCVRTPPPATPGPRRASARPPKACVVILKRLMGRGGGGPSSTSGPGVGFDTIFADLPAADWYAAQVSASSELSWYWEKNSTSTRQHIQGAPTCSTISAQNTLKTRQTRHFGVVWPIICAPPWITSRVLSAGA